MIQAAKVNKFIEIFKALDSDNDGVISENSVNYNIDTNLISIVFPILAEIGKGMDQGTFLKKGLTLYPQLSQHQKNIILKFRYDALNSIKKQDYTFSPKMDKKNTDIKSQTNE